MTRSAPDRTQVWTAIDAHRREIVRLLEDLTPDEWRQPSLCAGWTVRQVAAHLALQNTRWSQLPAAVVDMVRSGGLDAAIHAAACRHAELPEEVLVAQIRDRIGVWRPLPTVTYRETAVDHLVHGQDIALPLGRELPMPPLLAALAAERAWSSRRMFHARRRFAGYRFVADDADWAAGRGREVTGPIGALLLLFTGRLVATAQLGGPGAADLRARRTPSAP